MWKKKTCKKDAPYSLAEMAKQQNKLSMETQKSAEPTEDPH